MRPVTLNLNGIKDPQVAAALMEVQRASQDTLQSDSSSPGAAMATVPFPPDSSFGPNTFAYFSQTGANIRMAFAALTAFGQSLIAATNLAGLLSIIGIVPVANGGTGDSGTAWTTYTPTITAGSGAFTTVSATGRYKIIGKTVFLQISVTDTANGSAASYVIATLPVNAAATNSYVLGGFNEFTGFLVAGNIQTGGSGQVNIFKYDATFPLTSGQSLSISGVYESV